ncbi:hypothetical protein [Deinococcus sp.]|uniref:hypothetical protein n=1 Tax=Deinococcus sp. TaxID=47478 RepID=UPI0025BA4BF0|nr:hypothetical protein [Deinococcus sp.]
MTTLTDLRDDLNYDAWANARVLRSLEAAHGAPQQAVRLLGHVLGAQRVWLARLRGQDTSAVAIWPELSANRGTNQPEPISSPSCGKGGPESAFRSGSTSAPGL